MTLAQPASAQTIIAETSFEAPAAVGGQYTDTGDQGTDHDLVNNSGEPLVDFDGGGGEIGFDSRYVNTRNSNGLTDGDFVGVTDFTGAVSSYTDGSQGFQISDPDGKMVTEFDPVDLSSATNPFVALDVFIRDTGYEGTDMLRIYATDGTQSVDLVNLSGDALEGRGTWEFAQADLNSFVGGSVTLVFELDANSGSEAVYIDNVRFSSDQPLPVELVDFTTQVDDDAARLLWRTSSETNNAGFDIRHRAPNASGWATLGFVDGAGTTTETTTYQFETSTLAPGAHQFQLRQVDLDGTATLSEVQEIRIRQRALLRVSSPNPVVAGAPLQVSARVDRQASVELALYDVHGRRVRLVHRGSAAVATPMRATVSTDGLASGLYFLRLQGNGVHAVEKITIVR